MIAAVCTVLLGILLIYKHVYKRHDNYPPGPRGYPIVGFSSTYNKMCSRGYDAINLLVNQYGPIVGTYFGTKPTVFVHGYDAVKKAFGEDFDGRQDYMFPVFPAHYFRKGILFSEGDNWKSQRRFALRHLRDFGFGKKSMEGLIHEEIEDLISEMKGTAAKDKNSSIQMHELFTPSVINVLWHMVAGVRYKHDDPKFVRLLSIITKSFKISYAPGWSDTFPVLRKIAPKWSGYEEKQTKIGEVDNYLKETVLEHKRTFDPNHNRDFIDVYLSQIESKTDEHFDVDQLVATLFDFFIAGSETSANFLTFAFLYMMLHPDIQKKAQKELDEVVGCNRLPSADDKPKLVFTEAVLRELLRLGNVVPLTAIHKTLRDANLNGYTIPKGSNVLISIESVNMDKSHWKEPEAFRPERFISKEGILLPQDDHILSFGAGHRSCTGETLARQTTFLIFTSLLQAFNFSALPGQKLPHPIEDAVGGLTLSLPPFKFRITPRI